MIRSASAAHFKNLDDFAAYEDSQSPMLASAFETCDNWKMVLFLKRWFLPSRFDACCFVVAVHWLLVIFSIAVLPSLNTGQVPLESGLMIVIAAGTWVAIAATLCWKSNSKRRTLVLIVSSIASVCCVVSWYYCNADYVDTKKSMQLGYQAAPLPSFDLTEFLWATLFHLRNAVAVVGVVWLINLVILHVSRSAKSPLAKMIKRFRADRTGMLFGVATLLFFLAVVSRILSSGSLGSAGSAAAFPVSIMTCLFAWLVVLFWFPRSFVHRGLLIQKVVSLLLAVFVFELAVAQMISNASTGDDVAFLLAGVTFAFSVIGVGGVRSSSEEQPVAAGSFVGSRPTLVSILPVGLLTVAIGCVYYLDFGVLASLKGNVSLAQQLADARESTTLIRNSGGRIKLLSDASLGGAVWRVQFDADAPKDLVSLALGSSGTRCIELCDLTPEFDTSMLDGSGVVLVLTDCEVSHSQLSNILASGAWMSITGKFSVVDDGTEVDPGNVNSLSFMQVEPGVIQQFFDVAKCEDQMTYVMVHSAVGEEDWPAIEEVAQSGAVYLYGGWADGFQLPSETRSLGRVYFQDLSDPNGQPKPVDRNLILNTDIKLTLSGLAALDSQLAWKLMLLRGDFSGYPLEHYWQNSNSPIDKFAKELGLSYQLNDDQTIHSIYLPYCTGIEFEGLGSVRVLSFDPAWVEGKSTGFGGGDPIDLSSIKSMSLLEELYFEPSLVPEDLSFLANLWSLKHLQIPSVIRKVTGPIGFDACQKLESITFFGKPDNTTYQEILRLENLKRLVIVNGDNDYSLNAEYLRKLRKKFPGVEADIILPTESESLIPKPFRDYRDRIRKELREDTSWLDEILK